MNSLILVVVLAASWMLGFALPASAADIRDTKHNLSGRALPKARGASISEEDRRTLDREVCVFCHTPTLIEGPRIRSADIVVASGGEAPPARWQRSVDSAFAFSIFDDIGRIGAEGVDPVGSVSMACLSCHDSNQAFGVASGSLDHPFGIPYLGSGGRQVAVEEARRDLRNNDPSAPFRAATSQSSDFSSFRPAQSAVINNRRVWWASTIPSAQRSKSDLPLYPRHNRNDPTGLQEPVPFVECTSCHDPHTTREVFLRRTNVAGSLCMTCHAK